MRQRVQRFGEFGRLVRLSARLLAGRRYWLWPLLTLLWPAFEAFRIAVGWRPESYGATSAQGVLIGLPMAVLGILLGIRVIAGELDHRTLEIAYTVPGGSHRVWISKLVAAILLLIFAEALLAPTVFVFFTPFPPGALYGALQAAVFYTVLAMTLAAWFKSEATAALVSVIILALNGFFTGFGSFQIRISPFWNPAVLLESGTDVTTVFAWTLQNRVGFVLAIVAVIAMGFARAERREALLGG